MGGPIVRFGTTPEYWANWEQAFGKKKKSGSKSGAGTAKTAKKKPAKKRSK